MVVLWLCFCGGVVVVVFWRWCFGGCVFEVVVLWWCFCGGFVVVFWWLCGGVVVVVFL